MCTCPYCDLLVWTCTNWFRLPLGWVTIIHGPPNSGKDTQAEILALAQGAEHFSSGALLRSQGGENSAAVMAAGGIAPTEELLRLLERAIRTTPIGKPIVLDGVTRRPGEPLWLMNLLTELGRPFLGVIRLVVPDAVCLQRHSQRSEASDRPDDDPRVQEERLKQFHNLTAVILQDYYGLDIPIVEINGEFFPGIVAIRIEQVRRELGMVVRAQTSS